MRGYPSKTHYNPKKHILSFTCLLLVSPSNSPLLTFIPQPNRLLASILGVRPLSEPELTNAYDSNTRTNPRKRKKDPEGSLNRVKLAINLVEAGRIT